MAGQAGDFEVPTWQRQSKELGYHNNNEPENLPQEYYPARNLQAPRPSVFDTEPKSPKNARNSGMRYDDQHESGGGRRNDDDWLVNAASAEKYPDGQPPRQEPRYPTSVPHQIESEPRPVPSKGHVQKSPSLSWQYGHEQVLSHMRGEAAAQWAYKEPAEHYETENKRIYGSHMEAYGLGQAESQGYSSIQVSGANRRPSPTSGVSHSSALSHKALFTAANRRLLDVYNTDAI